VIGSPKNSPVTSPVEVREGNGLTEKELSQLLGIPATTIRGWGREIGRTKEKYVARGMPRGMGQPVSPYILKNGLWYPASKEES
jgi:hypothetical protein